MPVAPPTSAMGLWPQRWKCRSIITPQRCPMCSESAVGSMPRYAVTISFSRSSFVPGIVVCIMPRHSNSSMKFIEVVFYF